MIVCSQTCFLNDLTQLYPKEVLLKAHYYIADLTGPGNQFRHDTNDIEKQILYGEEKRLRYDQYGNFIKDDDEDDYDEDDDYEDEFEDELDEPLVERDFEG